MSRNIIRDGQTRRGYIAAVERIYESLEFEYRPMLAEEVELTESVIQKGKPKEAVDFVCAQLVQKLTTWSEVDENDKAVPISFDNIRRLPYGLLNKLYRVVAGLVPTDPVPNAAKEEQDELVARLIEAAKTGRKVGDLVEEEAEKN